MIEIRWHGRGGQGAFTASKILGAAAVSEGRYALSFPSFGPERRGAPIQAFTKIGEEQITDRTVIQKSDYIIFLDETLFTERVILDLKPKGKILINTKSPEQYQIDSIVAFDADTITEKVLGRPVSNIAMLAVLSECSKVVSLSEIKEALSSYLPKKIALKNEQVVDLVAESMKVGSEV